MKGEHVLSKRSVDSALRSNSMRSRGKLDMKSARQLSGKASNNRLTSFVRQAVSSPLWARPRAALSPAPPAPITNALGKKNSVSITAFVARSRQRTYS